MRLITDPHREGCGLPGALGLQATPQRAKGPLGCPLRLLANPSGTCLPCWVISCSAAGERMQSRGLNSL